MSTASNPRPTVSHVVWTRGEESARSLLALGLAISLTAVVLEVLLTGDLGWLFGLGFIAACGLIAWRVRPGEFSNAAAWPAVIMLITVLLLALTSRAVIARAHDSLVQAVVTGVAQHSFAFAGGYVICLAILGWRLRQLQG